MKNLYFSFFAILLLFNFSCDNKSSEFDNLMDEEEVKNSIELDTDLDFLETLSLMNLKERIQETHNHFLTVFQSLL